MKTTLLLGVGLIAAVTSAQTSGKDSLLPGAWNQAFKIRLIDPSSPDSSAPPETSTETDCLTQEDVADLRRVLLAGAEEDCSVSNLSVAEGKVSMSVTCKFGPGMDFAGDFQGTYEPTMFDMRGVMRSKEDNSLSIEAEMSARRVGVCKA
jgi:hypothetical protein